MDQTALGKYFHDYRTERHISMQDAAIGLTKSTISRFERGLTDLSTATASQLMYNIGMDAYSLAEALQDTNHELPDLADAVVTGDFNAIKQAVNEYAFHHNTRNARILTALITDTEKQINILPSHLEQQIADALAYPQTWGKVEFAIIALSFPQSSVELLKLVLTRIFAQIDHNLPHIIKTLNFACILGVARTGSSLHNLIAPVIKTLLAEPKYSLTMNDWGPYTRVINALVTNNDPQPLISAINLWHATTIANFLSLQIDKTPSIYHNSSLKDTYDARLALDDSKPLLNGVNLAKVRNQRGLTIDEVSINWSASAQSRFEHGKTELGFTRCLELLSKLEIDIDLMAHTADLPNSYSRARAEMLLACDELPINPTRFDEIVASYQQANVKRPAGIVAIESFALHRLASTYAAEHEWDIPVGTSSLSASAQDEIADYFIRLNEMSVRDLDLAKLALGEMNAKNTEIIVSAIIAHAPSTKRLADALLNNTLFLIDGPVYYRNWPLVKRVIAYLDQIDHSPALWQQQMQRVQAHLHLQSHIQPTADMRCHIDKYLDGLQIVYPHSTSGYAIENWLAFAMDGNYHHFDS